MAIRILSGSVFGNTTVSSYDILIVPAGEFFAVDAVALIPEAPAGANTYLGVQLNVLGDLISGVSVADFDSTDDSFNDVRFNIGQNGSILADDEGFILSGSGSTVTNAGLFQTGRAAIIQQTGTLNLENSGTIISGSVIDAFTTAVLVNSDTGDHWINNTGTITARAGLAVGIAGGAKSVVRNSGTMVSETEVAVEIVSTRVDVLNSGLMVGGVSLFGTFIDAVNSGDILGSVSIESESTLSLRNTGSVLEDVTLTGGSQTLINTGSIGDTVLMGILADQMVNAGVVLGRVDMGAGADMYRAVGTGSAAEGIEGGLGDDTLKGGLREDLLMGEENSDLLMGGAGEDTLIGGGGSDDLRGGTGDDDIQGDNGSDVMRGEAGADTLDGGSSNDTMSGGAGDDVLLGGKGNDRLLGAAGNDTLNGGTGRESMDGGGGDDVFVFATVVDSAQGTQRDQIFGFTRGDDLIDISALGDIAFSTSGAIGGGQGSVWADVVALGRHSLVRIDADGNGSIDSEMLVLGVTDMTLEDFLLG